jgi:hypothetical protein
VLDGYRKTISGYELAAEAGQALENCGLTLFQLESPRSNQAWFLAHGHLYGDQVYKEIVRIYSFDGYHFTEEWAPGKPMGAPKFKITKNSLSPTSRLSNPCLIRICGGWKTLSA